ncbi:hypothetical protein SIID45300_01024 [Candidatus Magnetaquicoccaceae bacterium FCR-1]|uniref:Uncharacterized protein n=1 Tax=Candidatus Magnetaquiglobus chichijimensis TaxID=3141448 RepID=A0ABQ0C750_9PROT
MSISEIYCDTFGNIVVTGNIVRIELATLDPSQSDANNSKMETRSRLIMPLDGFLRSFGMSKQVVDKLTEAGVLRRNPAVEGGAAPTR